MSSADQSKRPAGSNADEWHLFLCERVSTRPNQVNGLEFVAVQIAEAIETLERQVYVPGLWRCPRCAFSLVQSSMNANTGAIAMRDDPGEKCPNCKTPLWRVTERQAGNDMVDRCEAEMKRANVMLHALKVVEKWWLEDEMPKRDGAPYAIFAVRDAIRKAEGRPIPATESASGK